MGTTFLAPLQEAWDASRGIPHYSDEGPNVVAQKSGAERHLWFSWSNLNWRREPRRVPRSASLGYVFYCPASLQAPFWSSAKTLWIVLHGRLCFAAAKVCFSKQRKRPFSQRCWKIEFFWPEDPCYKVLSNPQYLMDWLEFLTVHSKLMYITLDKILLKSEVSMIKKCCAKIITVN